MKTLGRIGTNGSLRIHTQTNQLRRTSSNNTFQEHFRRGLGSGVNLASSALRHVGGRAPGAPALSASLNDAARSLSAPGSGMESIAAAGGASSDGDMGSLQSEMLRSNQDMLEQQMQVSRITTEYSTRSYILKAMFDSLKTIGSNIR